jgi:catechol 2,3-dioxygenase
MDRNLLFPIESIVKGTIHPNTGIGHVHLTVKNLDSQLEFYQKVIGFQLHWREENSAGLGVGNQDLLRLTEVRDAKRYRGATGMYHFAILLPNQRELARVISRLFSIRYPNSPTDHIMTKTTYLDDPEGNNIEIYADSPEDGIMGVINDQMFVQRVDGTPSSGRDPVDMEKLFNHLDESDSLTQDMPSGTKIGHIHLYVADLDETLHFYHDILGMDNMGIGRDFRMGMVSAGAYHHHIGFNTWLGVNPPLSPDDALGIRHFTIKLPDTAELDKVVRHLDEKDVKYEKTEDGIRMQDPSGIYVVLTV